MTDLNLIISQIRQRLEILYQEVDRLEAGGGGGGGGTDNYNDLSNKPKINSVTLSGNKSLADLGIAAAATTYTKTETNNAIDSAITELDVSTTAETGHYVKSIAQENGLIVPVIDTVQDYASPASTHPITSGAVASIQSTLNTAIAAKASMTDVYGVGGAITLNSDLDDYTTAGNYYSDSATTSASLSNCPHTTSIFQLFVYIPYGVNVHQILYPISAGSNGFYYKRMKTTAGWTSWVKFSSYGLGTAITENTNLNNITMPGIYYCNSATVAAGLTNCPVSTLFQMEVKCTTGSTRFVQEIVQAGSNDAPTTYKRLYTSGGWSSWYKFEGTVVS